MKNQRIAFALSTLLLVAGSASAGLTKASSVDDTLTALQAQGKNFKSFTGKLARTETNNNMGTDTSRHGTIVMEIKPDGDARLHAVLNDKQFGTKPATADKKEYVLDNGWVTDRDYVTKNETRRQLVRKGEKVNLFDLDRGLFPFPIGQDPKAVKAKFEVTKAAPAADDPADTIHLVLTPKPKSNFAEKFSTIDVWVDTSHNLPIRIATTDLKQTTTDTTDLTEVKVNAPLNPADFTPAPIDVDQWKQHVEELKTDAG